MERQTLGQAPEVLLFFAPTIPNVLPAAHLSRDILQNEPLSPRLK